MQQLICNNSITNEGIAKALQNTNSIQHITFNPRYNFFVMAFANEVLIIDISKLPDFIFGTLDGNKGKHIKLNDTVRMVKFSSMWNALIVVCENSIIIYLIDVPLILTTRCRQNHIFCYQSAPANVVV